MDAADVPVETIKSHVHVLRSVSVTTPGFAPDYTLLKKAAHSLAELAKSEEYVDEIVRLNAVEAMAPLICRLNRQDPPDELEKDCCFTLGLLAVKGEHQARIAQSGALTGLVALLQNHKPTLSVALVQRGSGGVARRAADAITNLAHENVEIKNLVRESGGIPPLVDLLDTLDVKVQRASCGALRTLAFKNEENKVQIVEQGALPKLIQLLRSEDSGVHYEAVGVIGNLVHSSQHVKKRVLEEGALQPVINLLSSDCPDSQRESALLLGQFATVDAGDTKARIVQRGAFPPLVAMLLSADTSLKEMAAFALGRLAQNPDNQAGAVQAGALPPLLELLESKQYNLQHNAAFALYGLAENEDNVPDMIREGALQRLEDCLEKLQVQASKDCVQKTISRMEQKLTGPGPNNKRALGAVVFLLRSSNKTVKQRAAMSLARLSPDTEDHTRAIFLDKGGMEVLLDMLVDAGVSPRMHREAACALLQLTKKLDSTLPVSQFPQQPGRSERSVYLGEQYINNPTLADVVFMVEGRRFYGHRIALLASSDAFRSMFSGGFREKEADSINIPNIRYEVFEEMMRFVYTGQAQVSHALAFELLQASDQYLLEGLKSLCETAIASGLEVGNVLEVFEMSEAYSAPQLAKRCILFALENYDALVAATATATAAAPAAPQPPAPLAGSPPPPTPGSASAPSASPAAPAAAAPPAPPPAAVPPAFMEVLQRMVPCLRAAMVQQSQGDGRPGTAGGADRRACPADGPPKQETQPTSMVP